MSWYYWRPSEDTLYEVGFYTPDGQWTAESYYDRAQEAADRVNYLNGGCDHEMYEL